MSIYDIRALASRLRAKEATYDLRLPTNQWIILRVDGKGFSSLTAQHFHKPFDTAFHVLMESAARNMLTAFQGTYAYTGSDEISLVLPPGWNLFDRRAEKLVSLSASAASVTFALDSDLSVQFDSRVSVFSTIEDVYDYFLWRQMDVERCALQTLCYWTLRQDGMTARKATTTLHTASHGAQQALLSVRSISFEERPAWQRLGIGLCWEIYEKTGYDPIRQQDVQAQRRRVTVNDHLPRGTDYVAWLRQMLGEVEHQP